MGLAIIISISIFGDAGSGVPTPPTTNILQDGLGILLQDGLGNYISAS
jgi:hypothetical protein